ncbi:adenylate/guanylate cyclase domain-containing protein [Reyranella soli]|uniref:adenylate/guanylate cyclase domain-containing protein n=1 Tax=Reyranella soli TaxID=1230389 RepID=UPI00147860FA|nr:adenylate/guanylate cyclase domain-containing protein [Reyranella soli]
MAREQRKLAAILFADAVGSSRLMGRDESGTVARLLEHLNLQLGPAVARRGGRVIRLKGDGGLIEFASAVDALAAAIDFQQGMVEANRDQPADKAIVFRVGLHLGDVIIKGDDIYGDDVNVAARLEAEAPPEGIVVSRAVRDAVQGRLKANLHALGDLALKNIERPVRAFRVEWAAEDWQVHSVAPGMPAYRPDSAPAPTRPDKPSVAVLPFQNMSGDPDQEYFVDGMVEDIITALSRFKSLFVVARNASFTYKGKTIDIQQVGRELGVRYLLEGSLRKAGGTLRVTAQLIDVETRTHLWADQFDGLLQDVFTFQDEVATRVVAGINPTVGRAEIGRAMRQPPKHFDAYDCYLRALSAAGEGTRASNQKALQFCARSMELDPNFAAPYGLAVTCYAMKKARLWADNVEGEADEVRRLVSHVARMAGGDALSLARAGWALAMVCDDFENGSALIDAALSYNPNLAIAWTNRGMLSVLLGDHAKAIEQLQRARQLSPMGSATDRSDAMMAMAHFFLGNNSEAIDLAYQVLRRDPCLPSALVLAAAGKALAGNIGEAHEVVAKLLQLAPTMRISNLTSFTRPRRAEDMKKAVDALRRAGMPE